MATATAITAGVGAIGGAVKFFEGRKMQREAQRAIDNFEWQDLQNPYENVQVSTLGSDLQREEAARNTATSVNALRSGGNRALIGGLGRVQAQNNLVNRQIGANLDQQQKQLDYAAAGQDVANQNTIENRQSNELAGYGQAMNVGMGLKYQGIDNMVNAVGAAVGSMGGDEGASKGAQVSGVSGSNFQNGGLGTQGNASTDYNAGWMS